MTAILLLILSIGMYLLQSPWFAANWVNQDYYTGTLFVLIALTRSIDFYSSYLLAMGKKHLLFLIQLTSALLFLLILLYCNFITKIPFSTLLALVLAIYSALFLFLFTASWNSRNAKKNIN